MKRTALASLITELFALDGDAGKSFVNGLRKHYPSFRGSKGHHSPPLEFHAVSVILVAAALVGVGRVSAFKAIDVALALEDLPVHLADIRYAYNRNTGWGMERWSQAGTALREYSIASPRAVIDRLMV